MSSFMRFSICASYRTLSTKSVDLIVTNSPGVVGNPVAAVAFYGVDVPAFDFFYDAGMIGDTVLAVGFDLIPVKVNDVAGIWGVTAVLPLIAGPKPALARYASSGFGNNVCIDIPALIGTLGNKARTPLYTGIKTHVRPIGVA